MYWLTYNLQKDGSWIAQGFDTEAKRDQEMTKLKELGYNPRKSKNGKQ